MMNANAKHSAPIAIYYRGIAGWLADIVGILNAARGGYTVTVSIPGRDAIRVTYGKGGKYTVGSTVHGRHAAGKALEAALDGSDGATFVVSA